MGVERLIGITRWGLWVWFLFVLGLFFLVIENRAVQLSVPNLGGWLSLRIDFLAALLLVMVGLLGARLADYARRYLQGRTSQLNFYGLLVAIVFSVSFMVSAGNLPLFFCAWVLTSHLVTRALNLRNDRPLAGFAVSKHRLMSRVGSVSLLCGFVLIGVSISEVEFTEIFPRVEALSSSGLFSSLSGIGVFFGLGFVCLAAAVQSLQFPFHFWLPESMETPTPVSALMHAGVVNAGGFLLIRLSPILQDVPFWNLILALLGSVTAVLGTLVMMTQNSIKKKLIYSTCAQMGMMIFACGLEAYTIALFHIFAHSVYKAHAFLSAASVVEESRSRGFKLREPSERRMLLAIAMAFTVLLAGFVVDGGAESGPWTYSAVLMLALMQNSVRLSEDGISPQRVWFKVLSVLLVAGLFYMLFEFLLAERYYASRPYLDAFTAWTPLDSVTSVLCFAVFCAGFWLSGALMSVRESPLRPLYAHLLNGLYLSQMSDRLLAHPLFRKLASHRPATFAVPPRYILRRNSVEGGRS